MERKLCWWHSSEQGWRVFGGHKADLRGSQQNWSPTNQWRIYDSGYYILKEKKCLKHVTYSNFERKFYGPNLLPFVFIKALTWRLRTEGTAWSTKPPRLKLVTPHFHADITLYFLKNSSNIIWCYIFHDVLLSFLVRSVGLWHHVLVLPKLHFVWLICSSQGQERVCCLQLSCTGTNPKAIDLQNSVNELIFFFFSRRITLPEEWSALAFVKRQAEALLCGSMSFAQSEGKKSVFTDINKWCVLLRLSLKN